MLIVMKWSDCRLEIPKLGFNWIKFRGSHLAFGTPDVSGPAVLSTPVICVYSLQYCCMCFPAILHTYAACVCPFSFSTPVVYVCPVVNTPVVPVGSVTSAPVALFLHYLVDLLYMTSQSSTVFITRTLYNLLWLIKYLVEFKSSISSIN